MIYITGDVHCPIDVAKLNTKWWPEQKSLTRRDYLIVCGDMGLVWDGSRHDQYWQKWFEDKPFTTLFVDGNHENHIMLNQYEEVKWRGGKIHMIQPHVYHLMRGQVFDLNGVKTFTMGGASSHDKEYRRENFDWWSEELPSDEEYAEAIKNLERNNYKVDLVVTHCVADSVQAELADWYEHDKLTNFLEIIVRRQVQYKDWYFGHYHVDKDLDESHHCLYDEIREIQSGLNHSTTK